jgi:Uma2 family endonuclease
MSAATASPRPCTAEDLLAMGPDARFELVEGHLIPMPPTGDEHGSFTIDLSAEVTMFVRANDLGRCWAAETGFILARDPDTVLAPDFSFIARERLNYPGGGRGFVPIAPDLVVETRSPSDRLTDLRNKMRRWLDFGVCRALLLDPQQRTITVYAPDAEPVTLTAADTLEGGDVLPGFALPLDRLFPENR